MTETYPERRLSDTPASGSSRVRLQGTPLRGRDRTLGGALVLPLRGELPRSRADDGRARRRGRPLDDFPMGPEVRSGDREAPALAVAPAALDELARRRDIREGARPVGLPLPRRRQVREHDRLLSLADAQYQGGQALSRQGAERLEGLGKAARHQHRQSTDLRRGARRAEEGGQVSEGHAAPTGEVS